MAFKRGDACIVSAPAHLVAELSQALKSVEPAQAFNAEFLQKILGTRVERVIGPGWLGTISSADFLPKPDQDTRLITPADAKLYERFLAECPFKEVEVSSLSPYQSPAVGVFTGGQIVAAGSYEIFERVVAHIGVLCRPAFRGKGFGVKVVSLITELALKKPNLGVQYRTLLNNQASVAAAKRVGFKDFAQTIAIRLKF